MKTHELLEDDADFYVKAVDRMFANLGMPGVTSHFNVTLQDTALTLHVAQAGITHSFRVRYKFMKKDVEKAVERFKTMPIPALSYALAVGRRWPEGEAAIAADAWTSQKYVEAIIKGPWPPGEAAIATHAWWSYVYARDVLKGRFPAGEPTLLAQARGSGGGGYAQLYAENVIKGPWPEAGIE